MTTTSAVCLASVRIAQNLGAAAILTCTESGHTAISTGSTSSGLQNHCCTHRMKKQFAACNYAGA
ncbi:MAG: pyruvate kinase alpha/beta domain-containing protein [Veillonella sp.]